MSNFFYVQNKTPIIDAKQCALNQKAIKGVAWSGGWNETLDIISKFKINSTLGISGDSLCVYVFFCRHQNSQYKF